MIKEGIRNVQKRKSQKKPKRWRKLAAMLTIAACLGSGAYYTHTVGLPDWAMNLILPTTCASDVTVIASADETKKEESQVPVYSTSSGYSKAAAEESTNIENPRDVTQKTVAQSTQNIPDAIAREGAFYFTYYEGGIYKIHCKEGYLTDIILQPGEKITAILGGDTARWMVDKAQAGSAQGEQGHVYVKPLRAGLATNLIINTDRHTYQLQLESSNWYCPMVGWVYAEEAAAFYRAKEEKEKENINLSKTSPDRLNFNYKFQKKKFHWTPTQVFDDGIKTYIRMPSGMSSDEAPALMLKTSSGELMIVNYRVQGYCYIVDRLFEEAEMRVGKDIVKIKRGQE